MKKLLLISFLIIPLFQCSRTLETPVPNICPSKNFSVNSELELKDHVTGNTTELNLYRSSADLSFTFNEVISYTITITGRSSGAEFKLYGIGNKINYNWHGNSFNKKLFSTGEILNYSISNICKNETISAGQILLVTTAE